MSKCPDCSAADASRRISERPREFRRDPPHTRARVMDVEDRKSVLCFLALTFGISSVFWGRSFGGAPLNAVVPFLMWTPGVCAIVTQLVFKRPMAPQSVVSRCRIRFRNRMFADGDSRAARVQIVSRRSQH